jgi:copper chaperone CopZ
MGDTIMEIDHCEDDIIDNIGKVLVLIPKEVSQ